MKGIPDGAVDLVLTDPPYQPPVKYYETRHDFPKNLSDFSIMDSYFTQFFNELKRIISINGRLYLFCNGNSYPLFWVKCYSIFKNLRCLVWDKLTAFTGYTWRHQHEFVLLGEMKDAPIIKTGDGDILKCRAVKVADRQHPAEKPIDLMVKLINKQKGVVLDPFLGSGTTAVACRQLNRRFIGIEINPDYCKIARGRLAQEYLFKETT